MLYSHIIYNNVRCNNLQIILLKAQESKGVNRMPSMLVFLLSKVEASAVHNLYKIRPTFIALADCIQNWVIRLLFPCLATLFYFP